MPCGHTIYYRPVCLEAFPGAGQPLSLRPLSGSCRFRGSFTTQHIVSSPFLYFAWERAQSLTLVDQSHPPWLPTTRPASPDAVSASLCFQKAVLPHQASTAEVTIAGGQWRLNGAQMSQGVSGTHRMCSERWELREPGISGLQGALISPIWEVLRMAWSVPLIALCHFVELLLCKASRANCLSGTASYVLIVLVATLVPFWNYSSAFWSLT